jgi:DNA-binding transcriptional LysR family regulator
VRGLSVAEQIRTLHAAEIDVGLATFPINDPALIVRGIFSEPLVLMVQSDSELAQRASIRLRELVKERFIDCAVRMGREIEAKRSAKLVA